MISCSIGLLPINWLKVQEPLSCLIKWRSTFKSPCCSIPKLCLSLCDPMDYSMPSFPVHHHFPEFVQTHIHWVGDAIQPSNPITLFFSCPQSFPASGSFTMCWLIASGGQSIEASASASDFPMNIQGWFPLGWTGLISLLSKGLWSLKASVFFCTQPSLWYNSHIHTWLL